MSGAGRATRRCWLRRAAPVSCSVVTFAPDATAAAAEMARVTAPAGRIVFSAWVPEGAIHEAAHLAQETVRRRSVRPPARRRSPGMTATRPPGCWRRTASRSPWRKSAAPSRQVAARLLDTESANHPLAVAVRAVLEPRGEAEALRHRMLATYEAANEDPDAFRVTSRYVVATARRA
jgi:hypothetical protein